MPLTLRPWQIITARSALQIATGNTIRGKWNLATDATGRAAASGAVARWVVEPGARVQAGDRVVEISTGAASRPVPVVELGQTDAEREQIAAANGQSSLSQKLFAAQQQLVNAQDRVARAKAGVASTHALVRRLLAGEKIPVAGSSSPSKTKRVAISTSTNKRLSKQQQQAEEALAQAKGRVAAAKSELDDAKKALAKARKQADAATTTLSKAETDFKAEKTTADVLQNARTEADDAASALKAAQTRADIAERAFSTQAVKVAASKELTQSAREEARQTSLTKPEPTQEEAPTYNARYLTADQAAVLVEAAVRESKAATREADRIHARVDDYQRQVKQTSQRVESASKGLQAAQQEVVDSVPRAVFVSSRAPVSGTITWISRLAREVGAGESVFGISQGRGGFLRFEDKTGAWKSLRLGQTLNAASASSEAVSQPDSSAPSASAPATMPSSTGAEMPTSTQGGASLPASEITLAPAPTFAVRITRISPPSNEGEPAQIDAVRNDGGAPPNEGATEMQAELPAGVVPISSPKATTKGSGAVLVPLSVILPRDGSLYVAVISPEREDARPLMLQWRAVEIQRQTAFDVEIKSGLREGEHIVDQPLLLLSQLKPEEKSELPVVVQAMA